MAGEIDPRLVSLLRASLALNDALRDIGIEGEIKVRLDRPGGIRLTQVVEARGSSVAIAGLTFEWPGRDALQAFAENDNDSDGFEDETPARR